MSVTSGLYVTSPRESISYEQSPTDHNTRQRFEPLSLEVKFVFELVLDGRRIRADYAWRHYGKTPTQRDLVSIVHSGARYVSRGYEWHAAFERRRRTDLLEQIGRLNAAMVTPSTAPPLTNATAP